MIPPHQSIADSEAAVPAGIPSDPRVSYNPSRLSFIAEAEEDATVFVSDVPAVPAPVDETAPLVREKAHGFELRRIIGKGGFGEVWEGVQHSLQRVIAIKRVRDDIYEKAREHSRSTAFCEMGFRHEALTTGALDHPNIVPVYDFGEDENGRPILAMKLVRGKPWDHIMWDDYNDPIHEFLNKHLRIFISVAQAVAFAHSRGVVHRDIKPAQVMVGEFGEVVLMDWGLAMVYDRQLADDHETPLKSGVIPTCDSAPNPAGTVAFMAPEQTQESSINIGPHTDVYLLAGTLYFLLTRTPPHAAPDSKAAFIEARTGLVDPPHERALGREIPEELASLCMRGLEPDISRRIQGVKELIDGIQAYLTGAGKRKESEHLVEEARELLEARKCNYRDLARGISSIERAAGLWPENPEIDSMREQFHTRYARLALSNRDLVLASAQAERISTTETRRALAAQIQKRRLYLASLRWTARIFMVGTVVLLIVVSLMAQGINRRAEEAMRLRAAAESGERAAVESRRNAEELVSFLVDDLYESLEGLGRLDLIDRVATEANLYYANLPATGSSDLVGESLRRARALRLLGDVQTQDRTLMLGEPLAAYRESLRISRELAERHGGRIDVKSSLAASLFRVGSVLIWSGDPEAGMRELMASEKINKEIHALHPDRADALLEATRSILLRAEVLSYMGQPDIADSLARDASVLLRTLEASDSTLPQARRLQARMSIRQADELIHLGHMEEAAQQLDQARRTLQLLALDNTYELQSRVELARVESLQAFIEMHTGDLQAANRANREAIEEMERIIELSVRSVEWQRHLVEAYIVQAHIENAAENLESGIEWASRAVVISRGTAFQDPDNILSQTWLAITYGIVGTMIHDHGRSRIAIDELDTAMSVLDGLAERTPTVSFWLKYRARYALVRAKALHETGSLEEALDLARSLEREWDGSDRVDRAAVQLLVANARTVIGQCLLGMDRREEARTVLEQALAAASELVENEEHNRHLARRTQAMTLLLLERPDEAAPIMESLRARGFLGRDLEKMVGEND